jgi:hypothetical protein
MKGSPIRIKSIFLVVQVLTFLIPINVLAVNPFYIAFKPGIYSPQSSDFDNSDTGFNGEIALGCRFTPNLAGEFGIGYSNTERDITFVKPTNWEKDKYEIDVIPIAFTLKAILPYKNWEFFGLGGGGAYIVFAELKGNAVIGGTLYAYGRDDVDAVMGAYWGAGTHYNITPTFFVGVEGKYLWTDDVDVRDEILGVSAGRKFDMDGIIATAIIGLRF